MQAKEEEKDVHAHLSKRALIWAIIGVLSTIVFGVIDITFKLGIFKSIVNGSSTSDSSIAVSHKNILPAFDTLPPQRKETAIQTNTTSTTEPELPHTTSVSEVQKKDIIIPISNIEKNIPEDENDMYVNKSTTKNDIAVVVFDNANKSLNSISSSIANLYRNSGYTVTTSLFTSDFLKSKYVSGIQSANARVLEKLEVASQVDYIIIAQYSNETTSGGLTKWITRGNLDVSIISCRSKSQQDAFTIIGSSGFDDQQHAEAGAKEKIINSYKVTYLKPLKQ